MKKTEVFIDAIRSKYFTSTDEVKSSALLSYAQLAKLEFALLQIETEEGKSALLDAAYSFLDELKNSLTNAGFYKV